MIYRTLEKGDRDEIAYVSNFEEFKPWSWGFWGASQAPRGYTSDSWMGRHFLIVSFIIFDS